MTRPSANLVVFSDGTGNSSGKLFRTNVWRTYQALDLADPQDPEHPRQFAFYDDGVGTSSFKPLAMLGGAIGVGLARNVRDLYAFVCRTYQSADDEGRPDRIYAFGFSRGAFTIRVLVGLISNQGILTYDGDEAALARNVRLAYRRYRRERFTQKLSLVGPIRRIRDAGIDGYHRARGLPTYTEVRKSSRNPESIAFVGLWDTVDAYGLPVDELTRAIDRWIWPLSMPNKTLSGKVKIARHALGLDDERNTFHPKLWDETEADIRHVVEVRARDPHDPQRRVPALRPRIDQVWFAGVHSNLGGGYPDDTLSYIPLLWILRDAEEAGLRFQPDALRSYEGASDENGVIYDSRKGLASYYRYNPRRIANIIDKEKVTLQAVRIHESVLRRIAVGEDGYAPIVLPPVFQVVKIDGSREDGAAYLGVDGDVLSKETEQVWNDVWKRRVAYFATLFASLALAASPLHLETSAEGACRSPACFISPVVRVVSPFVPSFVSTWLDAWTSNPVYFLLLAGLIVLGLTLGTGYATRVSDGMRRAWYRIAATKPSRLSPARPNVPSRGDSVIQSVRLSGAYQRFMRGLTQHVLPGGFVILLLLGGWALVSQVVLAVLESTGATCSLATAERGVFHTSSFCAAPDAAATEGSRYHIKLTVHEPWADGAPSDRITPLAGGPNGVAAADTSFLASLGVPWRRHLGQPWLKLMVRVGSTGSDTYALDWRRLSPIPSADGAGGDVTYAAEFTARTSGRLYVYVNDAVAYPLPRGLFYRPNLGEATISVTLLSETR